MPSKFASAKLTRLATVVVAMVVGTLLTARDGRAQAGERPFGADVFAGVLMPSVGDAATQAEEAGFQLGASVHRGERLGWLGFTGSYGSHSIRDVRVRELLGGVRATVPSVGAARSAMWVRFHAHILTGYAWTLTPAAESDGASVVVVGGGMDLFLFLRIQGDYVRSNAEGVPAGYGRGFVGAVVPLCFRGCRPNWRDGIPLK